MNRRNSLTEVDPPLAPAAAPLTSLEVPRQSSRPGDPLRGASRRLSASSGPELTGR